jgi:hypothetical protein
LSAHHTFILAGIFFISMSPPAALGRCAPIPCTSSKSFTLLAFELQRYGQLVSCLSGAGGRQYPAGGAQALPLPQGWVAKAPTRGSRKQISFLIERLSMLTSSIAAYARAVEANAAAGAPPFKTSSFG